MPDENTWLSNQIWTRDYGDIFHNFGFFSKNFLKKVKTNNLNEEEKELLQKELDGLEIFLEEKKKSLSNNSKEWEYCDMLFEERKENCEKKLFDLFIKLNGFEGR